MEADILQSLADVGYNGPLLNQEKFIQELNTGPKSVQFTSLISWLAGQIGEFSNVEESINPTTTAEDASSFLLELSAFLKELGCVNNQLMTGNVNQRLNNKQDKLILIDYLITELMAAKILRSKEPQDKSLEIAINESDTARNLKDMLIALKFQKPPEDITVEMLFQKLTSKVQETLKTVPRDLISKPLFYGELSNDQWDKLDQLQHDLHEEFKIRREMLLKRLDVTITSFSWSERIKSKEDQLNQCFHPARNKLKLEPNVSMGDVLASREDLAIIEKTSNAQVRKNTRSQVNRVIIGTVPDRGGRPYEQEPPPPEMPPWQKDRKGGGGGGGSGGGPSSRGRFSGNRGGGGGGGGGGRGGYQNNGGGYNDRKSSSSNFGQNVGGGYQSQGNYSSGRGGSHGSAPGPIGVFLSSSYQGSDYQSGNLDNYQDNRSRGHQSRGGGGGGGGGYNRGADYQSDHRGGYRGNQRNDYQQGGNYQDQYREGAYQNQRNEYQDGNKRGGYQRGGRVQGGWNQGGGNNRNSNYKGDGQYNRGNRY